MSIIATLHTFKVFDRQCTARLSHGAGGLAIDVFGKSPEGTWALLLSLTSIIGISSTMSVITPEMALGKIAFSDSPPSTSSHWLFQDEEKERTIPVGYTLMQALHSLTRMELLRRIDAFDVYIMSATNCANGHVVRWTFYEARRGMRSDTGQMPMTPEEALNFQACIEELQLNPEQPIAEILVASTRYQVTRAGV